ncbi:hypothetical protein C8J57DRAFT_691136 [Mycena rebaudengoi]|nr:hypothetical protein C8J57DRAFT_691136 [Mycena rebaudengoi]
MEKDALVVQRKPAAIALLCRVKNWMLPYTEIPEATDFCDLSPISTVLKSRVDVKIDDTSFAYLESRLPYLFADWRAIYRID